MSEQLKHKIVPLHEYEYYVAQAILLGVEYNHLYHMFVQRGDSRVNQHFKAWDADTMELLAHQDYPHGYGGMARQLVNENYENRYNGAGYFKEGYFP